MSDIASTSFVNREDLADCQQLECFKYDIHIEIIWEFGTWWVLWPMPLSISIFPLGFCSLLLPPCLGLGMFDSTQCLLLWAPGIIALLLAFPIFLPSACSWLFCFVSSCSLCSVPHYCWCLQFLSLLLVLNFLTSYFVLFRSLSSWRWTTQHFLLAFMLDDHPQHI